MLAMNFDQALRAERWRALTLGIPGASPGADASRLRTARRVWQEYEAFSQRVYARATGMEDPDPQASFCLFRLIEAGGNLHTVVEAPDFAHEVLDHIGRGYREEIVSDEAGTRWERFGPTIRDYRAAARETAHIRSQLEIRGLIPHRARGQAVHYGFTPPHWEPAPNDGAQPPF